MRASRCTSGPALAPYAQIISPYAAALAPYGGRAAPYAAITSPYAAAFGPYGGSAAPYGKVVLPYGEIISPYGARAAAAANGTLPGGAFATAVAANFGTADFPGPRHSSTDQRSTASNGATRWRSARQSIRIFPGVRSKPTRRSGRCICRDTTRRRCADESSDQECPLCVSPLRFPTRSMSRFPFSSL